MEVIVVMVFSIVISLIFFILWREECRLRAEVTNDLNLSKDKYNHLLEFSKKIIRTVRINQVKELMWVNGTALYPDDCIPDDLEEHIEGVLSHAQRVVTYNTSEFDQEFHV